MVPAELIDFLFRNKEKGDWLGFYCANAMVRVGRHEEARSLLVGVVRKNPGADWAWTHLAETYQNIPQNAMACLCRSLTCSNRDPQIAKATEAKTHRLLAKILAALGDSATAAREIGYANGTAVSAEDSQRYVEGVKVANRLVFGSDKPPEKRCGGIARSREGHACRVSSSAPLQDTTIFGKLPTAPNDGAFNPPTFGEAARGLGSPRP